MKDRRGVSLESIASAAGLHRRTLLRRFTDKTGMTPMEYGRAVRIARARELLESGILPQKAIAQSLGYKDVASFARVFRRAVGFAPGAYRKRFGLNSVRLTIPFIPSLQAKLSSDLIGGGLLVEERPPAARAPILLAIAVWGVSAWSFFRPGRRGSSASAA